MKVWPFTILSAVLLLGCGHKDPIERVVQRVSHEPSPSYLFKAIDLPETATPEQLITALSKRGTKEFGGFDFAVRKIVEVRSVEIDPMPWKYTAVLLATSDGQKVVLLQPQTFNGKWHGWYYRTYDAK